MPFIALLLDLLFVVVFAAIGRRNHGESSALEGIATTAWPFVVGTLVGWLILLAAKRLAKASYVSSGAIVWLSTVVVGMLLRQTTGRGTALAFIIVALTFNAVCLLGWRAIAAVRARRSSRR